MNLTELQREAHAIAKCLCRGCPNDADYGEGAFLGYCGPCLDDEPGGLEAFLEEYERHVRDALPLRKCRHGL